MKVLLIDIETSPNLAYVWGLWDQNVAPSQLVASTEMLCFAAKWLGDDVIHFRANRNGRGRKSMVKFAWKLLDQADVVIHYNGRRFDIPHLNREFLEAGLTPPSPFQHIDLLATVKHRFKFPSNKLEYVSEAMGLEGKVEHEGFRLWVKCMVGDPDAWQRMREYNERDVLLLEELYDTLLPWIERHPSHGAFTGEDVCPNCGSDDLESRGWSYTKTGRYARMVCRTCGKWSRRTKRTDKTDVTEVAS